ncbi:amidohydrolase family protein [Hoeflea sp. G2-23]|uniref:Amidohydrolase family protein n=1 Tax=Hoeflea algicola TaxID=2983763 RepID=A0ABT3ZE56_9HYPH|nr:amidohydrolase family protein [Hoeflea algicola]MCY0150085.1 amidohydrolase family protein [Hoeflea algicola]
MPTALVDSHHHLWELGRFPYTWLSPSAPPKPFGDHSAIKTDYLPHDYRRDMEGLPVVATVHVQANSGAPDPSSETEWLAGLTREIGLPDAGVGGTDLTAPDIRKVLEAHMRFEITRGMRALVAYEEDDRWHFSDRPHMLREPAFRKGVEALASLGLSLDLVIVAGQMPEVAELAREFPELPIIVDHLAMPRPDKASDVVLWTDGLQALGETANVSTKLSGLWTIDPHWNRDALAPFIEQTLGCFGPLRVM